MSKKGFFQKIYFLGIGGIGMSALARYMSEAGNEIHGYDREETKLTKKLEASGMKIHYDLNVDQIPIDIDLVVYTPAISQGHIIFDFLRNSGVAMFKRSEALEDLLVEKRVVAVAGTHGKTSTCAFLAHILNHAGMSVTSFVGGVMLNYDSNYIAGNSDWVVVEADEYDRSFLRLNPELVAIHAMDPDHLDIYEDGAGMVDAYKQFTTRIKKGGRLWVHEDLLSHRIIGSWLRILGESQIAVKSFGSELVSDARIEGLEQKGRHSIFEIHIEGLNALVKSAAPGRHNAFNALAAGSLAFEMGVAIESIADAIESFRGIERRFEIVHESVDLVVIDDYAHHPVELDSVIRAARKHFAGRKITVVFQPHLYTRTRDFKIEFAKSLDQADEVYLVDIYPAREEPIEGVDSTCILNEMKIDKKFLVEKTSLVKELKKENLDVLLVLGAGDIYREVPELVKKLINV